MKIDEKSLNYILNVVKTAQLVKISNIIIEPDKVRAIDDEKSVVLFQDEDVPAMPFGSIGLNRTDVFVSRFDIANQSGKFEVEAVMPQVDANKPDAVSFARALVMNGKGVKIDYRCANPATIGAPKIINDQVKYLVEMTPDTVVMLTKGMGAMNADEVAFISDKNGVHIEMTDINGDKFTYKFAERAVDVDDEDDSKDVSFNHRYPIKTLLPLFKIASDVPFFLTSRGMMLIKVNGLNLYVLPRA